MAADFKADSLSCFELLLINDANLTTHPKTVVCVADPLECEAILIWQDVAGLR